MLTNDLHLWIHYFIVVILIEDIAFALQLQLFSLLLYNGNVTVVVMLVCDSLFQLPYFFCKLLLYILNTFNTNSRWTWLQLVCSMFQIITSATLFMTFDGWCVQCFK